MATHSRTRSSMTLDEFLRWTRIDEKPYLEYYDGRIEVKVSPKALHSVLEGRITEGLNAVAKPSKLGEAFPELRCTFAGRSIVPDVVFLTDEHIQVDDRGRYVDEILIPPDIQVEARSPRQSIRKTKEKLEHAVANGCPLGWFLDPYRETIDVFRPGLPPERLPADGFLDAAPVLAGFRISVSEVFGWLIYRKPIPDEPGVEPR
jgi:Uma2 family endonuclease